MYQIPRMLPQEPIIALATPPGVSALSVIRLSGENVIGLVASCFQPVQRKNLAEQPGFTLHLGYIKDGERLIDEVMVSIFRAPHSYTGEDVVEISCHGSTYIQQEIIRLFLKKGCRVARAGEFTLRAFLNGKMDLSEAEAVADLIASDSAASHQLALQQMRGGISRELKALRDQLITFASLIELELDFAEEDVEFVNRVELAELLTSLQKSVYQLTNSFALGNALKNGISTVIAGEPNVGKSTLLNALLSEERALVSDIPGTTRDVIEDHLTIDGILFRFMDTAGIRETEDQLERMGINKTYEKIEQAQIIIYLFDISKIQNPKSTIQNKKDGIHYLKKELERVKDTFPGKSLMLVGNKADILEEDERCRLSSEITELLLLSAREHTGMEPLKQRLVSLVNKGVLKSEQTIITNARHYEALLQVAATIEQVQEGLAENRPGDLLSIDIRQALFYLSDITGTISTEDLLDIIFSRFCIGK